jgi:formylglycine-generating enzyme required for sulfatase activity
VQSFIARLNAKTGKHYRLPSEAEWQSASEESIKAPEDGSAWKDDGIKLLLRGGSWKYVPQFLRAANRMGAAPEEQTDEYDFRLARDLP